MFCTRWSTRNALRGMLIAVCLLTLAIESQPRIAQADAVKDWNAIAVQALATATPPRPGPVVFLDLAIVQAAVHDAVQAFDKRFEPYHVVIPNAAGSPVAAIATAAHDVLVNILPSQTATLDTSYFDYLAANGLTAADPGVAVGEAAAAGILALRANDGRVPNPLPSAFTVKSLSSCNLKLGSRRGTSAGLDWL